MRVDTNGSWSPDRYEGVPPEVRRNVQLNVSFHPTQITRDQFKRRLGRILDAGWQVGMINYVMEAHQAAEYEAVRDDLQGQFGVYVNPNPDAFDTSLASPMPGAHRDARRRLALLLPPADAERKTWAPTTGKSCFFPSIAYFISPNGAAERACGVKAAGPPRIDFIRDSAQVVPLPAPVRCPMPACLCLDRYAFLEELPERGRSLNLLAEYVRDCRTHQHEMSRNVGSRDIECPPWRPPG